MTGCKGKGPRGGDERWLLGRGNRGGKVIVKDGVRKGGSWEWGGKDGER